MNKNKFAVLPPRGWNSYDYYDTNVTEAEFKANVDVLADKLLKYGYEYAVVDIQWYAYDTGSQREKYQYIPFGRCEMDEYGRYIPCVEKFPSSKDGNGFKPLADYVHSKGLKFGIHIMRGIPREAAHRHLKVLGTDVTADVIADPNSICNWNPDMYGVRNCEEAQKYYDSIIDLYASWGVDFIKCDDICNTHAYIERPYMAPHEVEMLHNAIMKCGRPIVLSLSPGPALVEQAAHYCKYANMWRITDDFWDKWELLLRMFDFCEKWQYVVSEGCWPDCDMLPLGKVGKVFLDERTTRLTKEEQQTMMALWCLFRSPLMVGAELTMLDDFTLELLTNEELLSLQKGNRYPRQVMKNGEMAVWCSQDYDTGETAVAVFNFKDTDETLSVCENEINEVCKIALSLKDGEYESLLKNGLVSIKNGLISAEIKPHGCKIFKV